MTKTKLKPDQTITPREFEIAEELLNGCRDKDIGKKLGITRSCVGSMLVSLRKKTGTDNRICLAFWFANRYPTPEARKAGYIDACVYLASQLTHKRRFS